MAKSNNMVTGSVQSNDDEQGAEVKLQPETLRALIANIEHSGAMGRSKLYIELLQYLCESYIEGTIPKEIVIAIDVMGKDAEFDVKNDSLVRVYMHKLRHKLDVYYRDQGQSDQYRLTIPKGQYTLCAIQQQTPEIAAPSPPENTKAAPKLTEKRAMIGALLLFSLLLAANLFYLPGQPSSDQPSDISHLKSLSKNPIWAPLLADDEPIMLVIGDYFIFGEHPGNGKPERLVREFSINSTADLERHKLNTDSNATLSDLDLTYIPREAAFALKDILPILTAAGKTVTVRMSSDIKGSDLKSQHILYIGYISAMGELQSFVFQASEFAIGSSFDELIRIENGERLVSEVTSSASKGDAFYDYGLISSFPMLDGHQMMFISGTHGIGFMHMAHIASNSRYLQTIANSLTTHGQATKPISFEAIYKVIGYDGLSFDAERIHVGELDYKRIWGGEMMEILK